MSDTTKQRFVKIPTFLVPTLARPLNATEMEEWIVGSFLANHMHAWGVSPSLADLERATGRSTDTLNAIFERMALKKWIGRAKIKNEYQPGRFGIKWRFWLPGSSPLRDLIGHSSQPFVPVPVAIARSKSPIAVGMYLALHEQQRIDGAICTTPTELAGLLICNRRTVQRQLHAFGAVPVLKPVPGHAVYTMPRVHELLGAWTAMVWIDGLAFRSSVNSPEAADAMKVRAGELLELLHRSGYNDELDQLLRRVPDQDLRVLLRVLEDRYRTRLVLDSGYRSRLWGRFSSRLKMSTIERAVGAAHRDRKAFVEQRDEALRHLATACPTCSGDRLIEQDDGTWGACTSCT